MSALTRLLRLHDISEKMREHAAPAASDWWAGFTGVPAQGWSYYLRWPCGCEASDSGPDAATFDPESMPVRCPVHGQEGSDGAER